MNNAQRLIDVFDNKEKFEVINGVFDLYADINNLINIANMSKDEIIVTLIWHSGGIISNGGFSYLLEGDFNGDIGYTITAECFNKIGAVKSYNAFLGVFSLFPESKIPVNRKERIKIYECADQELRKRLDREFWDDDEVMRGKLFEYIMENKNRIIDDISRRLTSR